MNQLLFYISYMFLIAEHFPQSYIFLTFSKICKMVTFCFYLHLKGRSHSALRLNHGQSTSKSGLPRSRRCSRWCRVEDELRSIYRRGRTGENRKGVRRGKKSWTALLKILARGQPRAAHVVRTCNKSETHVIIRVPAVIKTWGRRLKTRKFSGLSGSEHGRRTRVTRWYLGK